MFRAINRIICLVICFQLSVGCTLNSSQIHIDGVDADMFEITGSIVKTFQRINNLIMPSAVAATESGEVIVYKYTDPANIEILATQKLYDGANTFKFSLPTSSVEGEVVRVVYNKASNDDMREKLEDTDNYIEIGKMDVILDANGSAKAAFIRKEIEAISDPTADDVKDVVARIDISAELGILAKAKGDENLFTDPYMIDKVADLVVDLKDGVIDENEFSRSLETLKAEARTQLVDGGRLDCVSGDRVTVTESAAFSGILSFSTTDADTKAFFGDKDFGTVKSADEGTKVLASFYDEIDKVVIDKGVTIIGWFNLKDERNSISTTCKFTVEPKAPEASSAAFDKFDPSGYGKYEEAVATLDKTYTATVQQFVKDLELAKVDIKTDEGKELWLEQIAIIDGWYDSYLADTQIYFKK